jgi:hypothetical protein
MRCSKQSSLWKLESSRHTTASRLYNYGRPISPFQGVVKTDFLQETNQEDPSKLSLLPNNGSLTARVTKSNTVNCPTKLTTRKPCQWPLKKEETVLVMPNDIFLPWDDPIWNGPIPPIPGYKVCSNWIYLHPRPGQKLTSSLPQKKKSLKKGVVNELYQLGLMEATSGIANQILWRPIKRKDDEKFLKTCLRSIAARLLELRYDKIQEVGNKNVVKGIKKIAIERSKPSLIPSLKSVKLKRSIQQSKKGNNNNDKNSPKNYV